MNKNDVSNIIKDNITSIKRIHQGVCNESYLINKKHVLRLKKDKDTFYSYKNELEVLHKTANLFLSENVTYLDRDGNKISDYIPKAHTFTGKDEEIVETAKMLKKLHESRISVKAKFKVAERYIFYKSNSGVKEKFKHEEAVIKRVYKIYRKYKRVVCHNDLVENNLLFTDKRAYLIDYEFAGRNIPLFDIASFLSENNISDPHKIDLFLKSYDICDDEFNDLEYMIMFLNLLWYYWACERYLATNKKIYKQISKVKKEHIINDMHSLLVFDNKMK